MHVFAVVQIDLHCIELSITCTMVFLIATALLYVFLSSGHLHIKSDVYSFGVFLVELLTTKLVSQDSIQNDVIPAFLKAGITEMPAMLAPEVILESRRRDSVSVAFIARHCLQHDWDSRPFMPQVARKLRRIYEEAREALERKAQAQTS